MQLDFHYYATYCAACIAGYSREESSDIAYAAQLVDCLSPTMLKKLKGPREAATTQLQSELLDADSDIFSIQNITAIWASFHFLPRDLYAKRHNRTRRYMNKYRLICGPAGALAISTVELAKGSTLQAVGIAMHVLADTWAHAGFAGTPSLVINNVEKITEKVMEEDEAVTERKVKFRGNPAGADDIEHGRYIKSPFRDSEGSVMNLGHGRIGHLPDYSFAVYSYMPAWGDYKIIVRDNPSNYCRAFCQMVSALTYIRDGRSAKNTFEPNPGADEAVAPYRDELMRILRKRRLSAEDGFKELCLKISGHIPEDFLITKYEDEYIRASAQTKGETYLGKFIDAAIRHKMMVTESIFLSGNILAGIPLNIKKQRYKAIRTFLNRITGRNNDKQGQI